MRDYDFSGARSAVSMAIRNCLVHRTRHHDERPFSVAIVTAAHSLGAADFAAFYTAASIAHDGPRSGLYDADVQLATQRRVLGDEQRTHLQPYFNPPFYAALLSPVAPLSPRAAYVVLVALEVALLVLCGLLAWRAVPEVTTPVRAGLVLGVATSAVVLQGVLETQTSLPALAALLGSMLLVSRHPTAAGLLLSVVLVKPQLAPAFVLAMLFSRQWSVLKGFGAGAAVLVMASVALTGPSALVDEARLSPGFLNGESS